MSKRSGKTGSVPEREQLLEFIARQNRPMRLDALLRALGLRRSAKQSLEASLSALTAEGKIRRMSGGGWIASTKPGGAQGRFRPLRSGGGIIALQNQGAGKEIFISAHHTGGAWPGDLVRIAFTSDRQGRIVEILERARGEIAAIVLKRKGQALLCAPASTDIPVKFSVPAGAAPDEKIKPGTLLALHPEKELGPKLWLASLAGIFGDEASLKAQEAIVKISNNAPAGFQPLALAQAAAFPPSPMPEETAGREDLRSVPFVTIDGADARDFDDAIHVAETAYGWLLRVAIADVSHYVRCDPEPGSLDAEALRRGNSWYFPCSVEPMLPQALSNGLCSLRPDEDRLAMLAELTFTEAGEPGQARFAQICMRSAGRLTYDEVDLFLKNPTGHDAFPQCGSKAPAVAGMLLKAYALSQKLALKRREKGALDFDLPEPAYKFGANGSLEAIVATRATAAHRLIEEFMIAANEAVARHLEQSGAALLYRIHPAPDQIKLASLYESIESIKSAALENLPGDLETGGKPNPDALQKILALARGTRQEFMINRLCLRAMPQARYQPENTGHFGLASTAYCHFTSPIRRYADLLVHRALKNVMGIDGHALPAREKLHDLGEHLNNMERKAMECEREMARRLGCLFLRDKVGEIRSGTVSGITDFGLFVEFDSIPVEGLIRMRDLGREWFELDQRGQRLFSRHSGKSWSLGQAIEVRILQVDLRRMEISLVPCGRSAPGKRRCHHENGREKHASCRFSERYSREGHGKKSARYKSAKARRLNAGKRRAG